MISMNEQNSFSHERPFWPSFNPFFYLSEGDLGPWKKTLNLDEDFYILMLTGTPLSIPHPRCRSVEIQVQVSQYISVKYEHCSTSFGTFKRLKLHQNQIYPWNTTMKDLEKAVGSVCGYHKNPKFWQKLNWSWYITLKHYKCLQEYQRWSSQDIEPWKP